MDKRPFIGGYIHRTSTHHSTTGHTIQMKGLPFSVTDDDIRKVGAGGAVVLLVLEFVGLCPLCVDVS